MICCLIASSVLAFLTMALRLPLVARIAVAGGVWLIVADAAYFDYFASPLSEPAGLLGILLVLAGIAFLGRGLTAGVLGLALVVGGGLLAVGAKTQLLPLVGSILLVLLLRGVPWLKARGHVGRFISSRAMGAVGAAAVLLLGMHSSQKQQSDHYYLQMNSIDTIFTGIVDGKHNTSADLKALGLPQKWSAGRRPTPSR
ncbi:hypothetical protein [Streptomyces sp. TP-A0356]|uniref:glycan biosynthesis hexose transferase WsfD n=1 Tax=Streptomyces sp. TP-A0356 TaxID=1359208 RepID=UPI0006E311A6|nr:hypothetical protein [Streptomyces sp. TP-A0356]